jgi:hypothetical protein
VFSEVVTSTNYFKAAAESVSQDDGGAHADGDDGGRGRGRGGRGRGRANRGRGRGGADLDGTRMDDAAAHTAKFGKWSRIAINISKEPLFWVILNISRRFTDVIDILLFTIQKYSALSRESCLGNLAELLFGKAEVIAAQLKLLTSLDAWETLLLQVEILAPDRVLDIADAIQRAAIRVHSDFDRRIMGRLQSFPIRLLWFGFGTHDAQCPERKEARTI